MHPVYWFILCILAAAVSSISLLCRGERELEVESCQEKWAKPHRTRAVVVARASPRNIKAYGDTTNPFRIYRNSDETPANFVGEFRRRSIVGRWYGNQQSYLNHRGRREWTVVVADRRRYLCDLQWDEKLLEFDIWTYQTRVALLPGHRHSYYWRILHGVSGECATRAVVQQVQLTNIWSGCWRPVKEFPRCMRLPVDDGEPFWVSYGWWS